MNPLHLRYRLQRAQADTKNNLLKGNSLTNINYDKRINNVKYKADDLFLLKNQVGNKVR